VHLALDLDLPIGPQSKLGSCLPSLSVTPNAVKKCQYVNSIYPYVTYVVYDVCN
jgi:hypothetical protein